MFKYKTDEELSKMSADERNIYAEEKRTYEKGLTEEMISEAVKGLNTKLTDAQKEEIKTFLTDAAKGKQISKEEFDEIKEQLAQIKDQNESKTVVNGDIFDAIEKGMEEFLPKVKAAKATAGAETPFDVEMTIKAPVNMSTGSVAFAGGVAAPVNYVYQNMNGQYASDVRQMEYIINYLSVGSTNKATIPYMDKLPTEGTMAITAEGALKPLISITFALRFSEAVKVAGRTKISEEALDDIPQIMSIIRNELKYQHDIAVQTAIFTKVGSIAPAFVAGSLAATTVEPSNYDAIRAAIYAIKIASKGLYIPNAALVASSDVYAMGATKDANNNYVFPPFVLPDGTTVSGVRIVEVPDGVSVPAGTFIVGDWKKLHYDVYKTFTVRIGQGIQGNATAANIVSDFESNMYTLIGESRFHLWIYENEKIAFIKTTFAAVKTAIEAA